MATEAATKSPSLAADAGPLIHLDELDCLDLLNDFPNILIAPENRNIRTEASDIGESAENPLRGNAKEPDRWKISDQAGHQAVGHWPKDE